METTQTPHVGPAEPTSTNPEYAGFLLRLVAYIIDSFILSFALGIVLAAIGVAMGVGFENFSDPSNMAGQMMLASFITTAAVGSLLVSWLYYALLESGKNQGTIGKMVLNLKVTDMNGDPVSFGRASIRFFGKFLSSAILYIGYFMIGFTEKSQGLHDMIAGCLVLKK